MKKILTILVLLLIPINIKALDISADKYIVMDIDSNRVLIGKNINEIQSVASISNIMTTRKKTLVFKDMRNISIVQHKK